MLKEWNNFCSNLLRINVALLENFPQSFQCSVLWFLFHFIRFLWFFFFALSVSLDCSFLIAPSVFSDVYLFRTICFIRLSHVKVWVPFSCILYVFLLLYKITVVYCTAIFRDACVVKFTTIYWHAREPFKDQAFIISKYRMSMNETEEERKTYSTSFSPSIIELRNSWIKRYPPLC